MTENKPYVAISFNEVKETYLISVIGSLRANTPIPLSKEIKLNKSGNSELIYIIDFQEDVEDLVHQFTMEKAPSHQIDSSANLVVSFKNKKGTTVSTIAVKWE